MGSQQRTRTAPALVAAVLALVAGCTGGSSDAAGGTASSSSSSGPAAPSAQLALSIADGATDVSPAQPLQIDVTDGELDDVTVTDGSGAPVTGAVVPVDAGTALWTPAEGLDYGTSYTVTASAASAGDQVVTGTSTFTTVTPRLQDKPDIGPLDGTTVGVGMPIRVFFDEPVTDKAAVERHLTVTSSTPTDGVWSWVGDSEVHFRPSTYWPADTDVTVQADLFGVDLGDGVWGEVDRTVSFHVGEEHVSVADAAAHTLTVSSGGQVLQTYPMSAGSAENPTRNGAHVVLEKFTDITMDSATFGLAADAPGGYRTPVEYATRISNNGEFVHGAPWSVGQQGSSNVSHGCINLSDERAEWFYEFSRPGDVVEVVGSTGGTLSAADGDIYDWAVPWDRWTAGSALS